MCNNQIRKLVVVVLSDPILDVITGIHAMNEWQVVEMWLAIAIPSLV
jgi:hypothetical protein